MGRKLLDQRLVTEFAEYRALKTKIEKWLKTESEDILAKIHSGYICPVGGPYLVVLAGQDRKVIDWKDQYFARLRAEFESQGSALEVAEQLATIKIGAMEREAGTRHIDFVDVKTNPAYQGKLLAAVVRKLDSRTARGF